MNPAGMLVFVFMPIFLARVTYLRPLSISPFKASASAMESNMSMRSLAMVLAAAAEILFLPVSEPSFFLVKAYPSNKFPAGSGTGFPKAGPSSPSSTLHPACQR